MASSPTALIGLVVVGALDAGGDAGDDRLLRALVQPLATPLDRAQELVALDLGQHLLAFLDDPARLLDLLGDRRPHLVEDVVDLLAVDANLVGQRNGLRVVHEVVQLVDQNQYIHGFAEFTEETRTSASAPEPAALLRLRLGLGLRFWRGGRLL